jgi:hypothetical protein
VLKGVKINLNIDWHLEFSNLLDIFALLRNERGNRTPNRLVSYSEAHMRSCYYYIGMNQKLKTFMKAVQVVTEEQLETKLNQFNEIDLDDDDAVEEYLAELESYNGSVII